MTLTVHFVMKNGMLSGGWVGGCKRDGPPEMLETALTFADHSAVPDLDQDFPS